MPRIDADTETMRIAVGIATHGRAEVLREILIEVGRQTRLPDRVIVCATIGSDLDAARLTVPGIARVELITCAAGLPRQRNHIMQNAQDCEIVLFLDDDFMVSPGYVRATLDAFANRTVVASTGMPVADGVKGPGIGYAGARRLIANDIQERDPGAPADVMDAPHGYGCNMAVRLSTVRTHDIYFDERLPLYAWSEDVDFTHRIARYGRVVKLARARGVHLGVKLSRSPGINLGYSQVANPIYLRNKGSYSCWNALQSVGRNLLANVALSVRPEPWIDRRGRLAGNVLAFWDLLRGRMAPERILEL